MKFTREDVEGQYTIAAYEKGKITINALPGDEGQDEDGHLMLNKSFVITPTTLIRQWPVSDRKEVDEATLVPLHELEVELVLLGTGNSLHFPTPEQLAALVGLGIGYEVMDSAAACRTYNILASEGRKVAAAIIVEEG